MLFDYAAHIKYSFLSGILKDLKFWIKLKIIKDLVEDFKYKGLQYSSAHWLPTDRTCATHWQCCNETLRINFPAFLGQNWPRSPWHIGELWMHSKTSFFIESRSRWKYRRGTVPFQSIRQSRVTVTLWPPKFSWHHGDFGWVPNSFGDHVTNL